MLKQKLYINLDNEKKFYLGEKLILLLEKYGGAIMYVQNSWRLYSFNNQYCSNSFAGLQISIESISEEKERNGKESDDSDLMNHKSENNRQTTNEKQTTNETTNKNQPTTEKHVTEQPNENQTTEKRVTEQPTTNENQTIEQPTTENQPILDISKAYAFNINEHPIFLEIGKLYHYSQDTELTKNNYVMNVRGNPVSRSYHNLSHQSHMPHPSHLSHLSHKFNIKFALTSDKKPRLRLRLIYVE